MQVRVKLGDICTVVSGSTPKSNVPDYWDGDIIWITPAELTDSSYIIYDSVRHITQKAVQETSLRPFPAGTVILSSRAPIGKTAIAGSEMYCNQGFKNLICSSRIYNKYLYFFLSCKTDFLNSLGRGATFKEISKSIVEGIEIPLPDVLKQRKIADEFEQIQKIEQDYHRQLSFFDQLVKSRFVEMFGEPFQNPFGWKKIKISEVLGGKVSNGYFAKREDYVADGNVAVLGVANVVNRMYSQCAELPRTNASLADIEKYSLQYGDILFCRSSLVAEGIGKASIVPRTVQPNTLFECHVIRLPLDLNLCVPEYMQVLTTTKYFRQQILSQAKTATMTTIGQDGILKSLVLLPPLDLQQQFLSFVAEVDKSKLAVTQSLEKLETLKKSLMQQYFG